MTLAQFLVAAAFPVGALLAGFCVFCFVKRAV